MEKILITPKTIRDGQLLVVDPVLKTPQLRMSKSNPQFILNKAAVNLLGIEDEGKVVFIFDPDIKTFTIQKGEEGFNIKKHPTSYKKSYRFTNVKLRICLINFFRLNYEENYVFPLEKGVQLPGNTQLLLKEPIISKYGKI
jgi:hypothetical protein